MSTQTELRQLEATLKNGPVIERRQAVNDAAALIASRRCDAYCRRQVSALLEWVVANESSITVRERAQTVLDNVADGLPSRLAADERQHMIGGECETGHIHYYDKRTICTQTSTLVRGVGPDGKHKLLVPCREPGCPKTVTLHVDCEPYR